MMLFQQQLKLLGSFGCRMENMANAMQKMARGIVHPVIDTEVTFEDIDVALTRMESRQIRGVVNLSYPVMGANNRMLAALNVPYIERIDKKVNPSLDEVQGIVQDISARLSRLMGDSSFGS